MALITCHFFAETLEVATAISVILPEPSGGEVGAARVTGDVPPPVLYLLHGLSDDETIWTRRTSIERYAAARGLAVVMPRGGRSWYQDEAHGFRYWTFLTQELPELVQRLFRVSAAREDTFVAGLSMGGYGAMRWALTHPSVFAAAASLSGALDVADPGEGARYAEMIPHVWGGRPPGPDADLLALLAGADPAELPALYVTCGTEDHLAGQNRHFLAAAQQRGIPVETVWRAGDHEWGFWDAGIQDVLAWLPIRPR